MFLVVSSWKNITIKPSITVLRDSRQLSPMVYKSGIPEGNGTIHSISLSTSLSYSTKIPMGKSRVHTAIQLVAFGLTWAPNSLIMSQAIVMIQCSPLEQTATAHLSSTFSVIPGWQILSIVFNLHMRKILESRNLSLVAGGQWVSLATSSSLMNILGIDCYVPHSDGIGGCTACSDNDSSITLLTPVSGDNTDWIARVNNTKLLMDKFIPLSAITRDNYSLTTTDRAVHNWDLPTPDTPFSFSRLASSSTPYGVSYLYHQFDNFTFIEHEFNGNISGWTSSTTITISP